MKSYQSIPIQDCNEPLIPIPGEYFAVVSPHPYIQLGANYQGKSPYFLREGVINALLTAQNYLQEDYPGWKIQIFDAYRPICVQQFMVDYTFASVVEKKGLKPEQLSPLEKEKIWQQVSQMWAIPSENPLTPPPHSTGAAVDITLVDNQGQVINMGGEIDELSERSHPNYYVNARDYLGQKYDQRRSLLNKVMEAAGFCRHPGEWWHFSLGDQMWAWQYNLKHPQQSVIARYGRV